MITSPLQQSRVILGVTGGIAAYKSADLCRRLIKAGASVRAVMTESATRFVTPLTFETLTGRPVYVDMFSRDRAWEMEHISFAQWGEVLVVAPATANCLAKMAQGIADDPLSTTVLAFRGPVVAAPAMNTAMWENAETRANIEKLRGRGVAVVNPGSGELACGDVGAGRLADSDAILNAVEAALLDKEKRGPLAGKKALVTAGPTAEPIDPVRHLSNASTGRMGFALADEARRRGARVTLVCGPTPLDPPARIHETVRVRTAAEMRDAVVERLADQDILLFTAAVADYAPEAPSAEKIKKANSGEKKTLTLVRTPDVAAEANAARKPGQTFVGFAAETDNLLDNARAKMQVKGFDFVVANQITADNPAFAAAENQATLLSRSGESRELPSMSKESLAVEIWDFVLDESDGGTRMKDEKESRSCPANL